MFAGVVNTFYFCSSSGQDAVHETLLH